MKKFLLLLLAPFVVQAQSTPSCTTTGQPCVWVWPQAITQNIRGGSIVKGDTVLLTVKVNPNGTDLRSIYFDFQHQYTAISLIDVTMPAALGGGAMSVFPSGTTTSVQNYFYQYCKLNKNANNTTAEGWTNYYNSGYTCNSNSVPNDAINRIMASVSSTSNLQWNSWQSVVGDYMYLRFKVTNVTAGFAYDSIYMNFAAGYRASGNTVSTTLVAPRAAFINLAAGANNLITGVVPYGSMFPSSMKPATIGVQFYNLPVNNGTPTLAVSAWIGSTGDFTFASALNSNTAYNVSLKLNVDSLAKLSNSAITISDYTLAYTEFLSQNLDKTYKNTSLTNGMMYIAADVNNNGVFDGSDVQLLYNYVTGIDTLSKRTSNCGSGCEASLRVYPTTIYDTLSVGDWKNYNANCSANCSTSVPVTTTNSNQALTLKYLVSGDVNLSHSSPRASVQSSLRSNILVASGGINVNLTNSIVTSNNITIPFDVDAGAIKVTGLQFEVQYDPTKVKFERLDVNTPSWVSFVNASTGTVRFGALDREVKNTITGKTTPFKLQFTSLQAGIDINSAVTITPVMDATDDKGHPVDITLNTTLIKLIGANNFRRP